MLINQYKQDVDEIQAICWAYLAQSSRGTAQRTDGEANFTANEDKVDNCEPGDKT